jgi:hypothetical protein
MKLALASASATLLAVMASLIYVAVNVTMDFHQAGLIVSLMVIFGALTAGAIGGFIGSFFEETN